MNLSLLFVLLVTTLSLITNYFTDGISPSFYVNLCGLLLALLPFSVDFIYFLSRDGKVKILHKEFINTFLSKNNDWYNSNMMVQGNTWFCNQTKNEPSFISSDDECLWMENSNYSPMFQGELFNGTLNDQYQRFICQEDYCLKSELIEKIEHEKYRNFLDFSDKEYSLMINEDVIIPKGTILNTYWQEMNYIKYTDPAKESHFIVCTFKNKDTLYDLPIRPERNIEKWEINKLKINIDYDRNQMLVIHVSTGAVHMEKLPDFDIKQREKLNSLFNWWQSNKDSGIFNHAINKKDYTIVNCMRFKELIQSVLSKKCFLKGNPECVYLIEGDDEVKMRAKLIYIFGNVAGKNISDYLYECFNEKYEEIIKSIIQFGTIRNQILGNYAGKKLVETLNVMLIRCSLPALKKQKGVTPYKLDKKYETVMFHPQNCFHLTKGENDYSEGFVENYKDKMAEINEIRNENSSIKKRMKNLQVESVRWLKVAGRMALNSKKINKLKEPIKAKIKILKPEMDMQAFEKERISKLMNYKNALLKNIDRVKQIFNIKKKMVENISKVNNDEIKVMKTEIKKIEKRNDIHIESFREINIKVKKKELEQLQISNRFDVLRQEYLKNVSIAELEEKSNEYFLHCMLVEGNRKKVLVNKKKLRGAELRKANKIAKKEGVDTTIHWRKKREYRFSSSVDRAMEKASKLAKRYSYVCDRPKFKELRVENEPKISDIYKGIIDKIRKEEEEDKNYANVLVDGAYNRAVGNGLKRFKFLKREGVNYISKNQDEINNKNRLKRKSENECDLSYINKKLNTNKPPNFVYGALMALRTKINWPDNLAQLERGKAISEPFPKYLVITKSNYIYRTQEDIERDKYERKKAREDYRLQKILLKERLAKMKADAEEKERNKDIGGSSSIN